MWGRLQAVAAILPAASNWQLNGKLSVGRFLFSDQMLIIFSEVSFDC
jgi:hypothetical protein